MNELITLGTDIKRRIISEINTSTQTVRIAMAWFTDRDIADALIEAKKRNVTIEVILSSNSQNDTVKQMLRQAGIQVHAFETGDERGIKTHARDKNESNLSYKNPIGIRDNEILKAVWSKWAKESGFKSLDWKLY
jgi:phosphatidylserine/phosphatidylglycerophosphate/cardiolipin synthase-like enzyme